MPFQSGVGRPPFAFTKPDDLTGLVTKKSKYPVSTGGYADVWMASCAKSETNEQIVAVKVLRSFAEPSNERMKRLDQRLNQEVVVWQHLDHNHVIPLLGVVRDFGPLLSIVSPWMDQGYLTKYLDRNKTALSESRRHQILQEVGSGLAYLHSRGIIHSGLTGSSILLDRDGRVHLSDFGLNLLVGALRGSSLDSSVGGGSIRWMAPESVFDNESTMSSDVYSFGSIMYQVLTNMVPYQGIKAVYIVLQLRNHHHPSRPISPPIAQNYWDLMLQCWHKSPPGRPTMDATCEILSRLQPPLKNSPLETSNSPLTLSLSPLFTQSTFSSSNTSPTSPAAVNARSPCPLGAPNIKDDNEPRSFPYTSDPKSSPSRIPSRYHSPSRLRPSTKAPSQETPSRKAICGRCGAVYKKFRVAEDDDIILIHQNACHYHTGKLTPSSSSCLKEVWSCCSGNPDRPGCYAADQHHSEDHPSVKSFQR